MRIFKTASHVLLHLSRKYVCLSAPSLFLPVARKHTHTHLIITAYYGIPKAFLCLVRAKPLFQMPVPLFWPGFGSHGGAGLAGRGTSTGRGQHRLFAPHIVHATAPLSSDSLRVSGQQNHSGFRSIDKLKGDFERNNSKGDEFNLKWLKVVCSGVLMEVFLGQFVWREIFPLFNHKHIDVVVSHFSFLFKCAKSRVYVF